MKTTLFTSLMFFCFLMSSLAQDQVGDLVPLTEFPESISLTKEATAYAQAIMDKNFNAQVELTHTDIIKMGGGESFVVEDLKAESNIFEKQGFQYVSMEVGSHPEFIKHEDELQTNVPIKFNMTLGGKEVESWINLFAVSTDEGKTWRFVNLEKFDEPSLREFVTNVSSEFIFPK